MVPWTDPKDGATFLRHARRHSAICARPRSRGVRRYAFLLSIPLGTATAFSHVDEGDETLMGEGGPRAVAHRRVQDARGFPRPELEGLGRRPAGVPLLVADLRGIARDVRL